MFKLLTMVLVGALSWAAQAQEKFVILVPGYFSRPDQPGSLLPAYFSDNILTTLKQNGFTPVVIQDLDPVGSLAKNAAILQRDLTAFTSSHPGVHFQVIAHSAGGLYMAEALTHSPDLPIDHVVTLSTPYKGVKLVDLCKWIPGVRTAAAVLDMSSLEEFESERMPAWLAQVHIPSRVKWTALAGSQPMCSLFSCAHADHMSWILSVPWRFANTNGDGIVAVDSSLAQGTPFQVENWSGYTIPLEHWEQTMDAKWFEALGVTDPNWIRQKQIEVYTAIAKAL